MSVMRPNKPDSSPCIGRCSHNVGDDICKGCGRTVDEVLYWNTYPSEKKIEVKQVAAGRINRVD